MDKNQKILKEMTDAEFQFKMTGVPKDQKKMLARLREYEDTNLSPEEIGELREKISQGDANAPVAEACTSCEKLQAEKVKWQEERAVLKSTIKSLEKVGKK